MVNYLLFEGIKGLFKNRMMTFASIATIVLSLLTIGISYSVAINFDYIISQLEEKIGISVYLDDMLDEQTILELQETIKNMENVKEISYITKDMALKNFAGNDYLLYEEFKDDNPLPASFEIRATEVAFQKNIVSYLEKLGLEVSYFEAEIQILTSLNSSIQMFLATFIGILIIISLLLITNTIRLTVFVRKKEIEIMKFIGATDTFIRTPFIIEGILIGIIGAIIPSFCMYYIYEFASQKIGEALAGIVGGITVRAIDSVIVQLLPIYAILAISISIIGSVIALRKHLRV
ncbi:hypothetical protein AN641_09060 [Candidatus Epulonipiscioides gigas]|nr:hypothetical protein AN641_09060 [Epulopiscium sp. SCG-C07WGA-EpuloA2]